MTIGREDPSPKQSITLPWPPSILSPNARTRKPAFRAAMIKKYRTTVAEACWMRGIRPETGQRPSQVIFHPRNPKQDKDNAIGWFKAGQDGVADALACDDNEFDPEYRMGPPVTGGAVVVIFDIPGT